MHKRGYFHIGIFHGKKSVNIGTLWRTAFQLGASSIFTVGRRYRHQDSDVPKSWKHVPLYHYEALEEMPIPKHCQVVGIEQGGVPLSGFSHPERTIYLLGAEDHGLSKRALEYCDTLVSLESIEFDSYNVAVAGSLVMYDRVFG